MEKDMRSVQLEVPGEPKPQQRPRSRAVKKNGKWISMAYNAKGPDMDYRTRVADIAAREMKGSELLSGALIMQINFWITKPKSKPKWKSLPDVKPDIDNLVKAVKDALEGIVFANDSQVCTLVACKKYTINRGAFTQIIVGELPEK